MSTIEWKLGIYLLLMGLFIITLGSFLAFLSGQRIDVNLFTDTEGRTLTTAGFLWILLYPAVIVWLLGDIRRETPEETHDGASSGITVEAEG